MSILPTLLFAVALQKRFNFTGRIYRRAHRAYAFVALVCNPTITWLQFVRVMFFLFFFAGPVVWTIIALLTLMIP